MSVLITGASGAICQKLTAKLRANDIRVNLLTANLNKKSKQNNIYYWNTSENLIEDEAFESVEYIVHLAGAGIADARWTKERKQVLHDSRVQTAALIFKTIKKLNKSIKKYISAGAIGIYEEGIKGATESDTLGTDYMASLCKEWENTTKLFEDEGIKTAIFRTGIVLDKNSGFYQQIAQLAKFYLAAVPGSGKQWVSWIHMDDIINMYYDAIVHDDVLGTYNATAPQPESLNTVISAIAQNEKSKIWLPNIPPFVLKLLYGEMSQVILSSKHVIPQKWINEGRMFNYSDLNKAIQSL